MKRFQFGEIVLISFPLVSGALGKKRPALVLFDTGDSDVVLARITSKKHQTAYDVALNNWEKSGLLLPSTVRLHKIATMDKNTILNTMGILSRNDLKKVQSALKKCFAALAQG